MRSKHDGTLAATRPRMGGRSRRRACMRPRHRHAHVAVLLAAALLPPTTTLSAQTTALRCGRLIDGISAEARENVTVIVRDGRVAELRDGTAVPDGVDRALDMRGGTCLPGMMDLHTHLLIKPDGPVSELDRSSADRALDGLHAAQKMLHAGFTTVRNPGDFDTHYAMVSVKRSIAAGEHPGPRIFVAPHALGPTGGHGDLNTLAPDAAIQTPTRTVNGVDEIRAMIREQVKYGADWIKIMATGGVMSAGDDPTHTAYVDEEMRAAVDETHRLGRRITVHAIGTEGLKQAVAAGVNSVEHGILIDEEAIEMMKARGTWLIPTIYVLNYVVEEGPALGYPAESVAKGRVLMETRDDNVRRAIQAGVKIAFGSDTIFPHEWAAREFAQLVRLGMSPMDAIRTATYNAAQVLGIEDEVGTLQPGMVADIIAVDGNPLDDITELEQVDFVMQDGEIIKDERPRT
ncbi:MAG: amidohydrolase family protein [Gemmatimonadota bacterium]|nr:amidohydrolase family protein [Gemmatimonadota bacterium]